MVALLIHSLHIGFVVFVPLFESGVAIAHQSPQLCLLRLLQCRDWTEFIKYLMFLLEAEGCQKIFEIVEIK